MTRSPDWQTVLAHSMGSVRDKTFEWGGHDCVLWAAGVVRQMTGADYAAEFRGRYRTKCGAYRILNRLGGLSSAIDQCLPRIPVAMAGRGDVVLHQHSVGICDGLYSFFVMETGLGAVRTTACEAAWRVE